MRARHDDKSKRSIKRDGGLTRITRGDGSSERNVVWGNGPERYVRRDGLKRNVKQCDRLKVGRGYLKEMHEVGRGYLQEMHVCRCRQKGGATVEVAIVVPVIAVLLIVVATMINAGSLRLKCIEAAGSIARTQITDSDNKDDPTSLAVKKIGSGAVASVSNDGEWIRVTVEAPILGDVLNIFPLKVAGEAYVKIEDTS